LGPGPRLIKKEFTGTRSHKGWEPLVYRHCFARHHERRAVRDCLVLTNQMTKHLASNSEINPRIMLNIRNFMPKLILYVETSNW